MTTEPRSSAGSDDFAHELTAARFEEKQLGLRRHAGTFRRELEQVANLLPDRSPAGLTRDAATARRRVRVAPPAAAPASIFRSLPSLRM